MNTRRAWAVGLVVVLAGCQDARSPLDITPPDFAVSDGAHGGNTHFYFLPPLVPTPTFSGEFNPLVKPTVVISELPDPTSEACSPGTVIRTFKTEIAVDPVAETYSVNYNTGTDLTTGQDYRICVRIGGAMLGFRDIHPDANGADVPRNTDQLPIYQFNNGRNLPIKFRIEKGTLCSLDAIDCTETTLDAAGGTAVCDDGLCGLQVPEGALTDEFTFVVQVVECTRDGDGRINWLPTDLPQFGACLEIHNEGDAEWTGFAFEAVAGACIDAPGLSHEQFDRLQLHHLRESDGVVEALPNRAAGFLTCGEIASSAPLSKKLMYYAGKGLRKMQYAVAPWLGAPPLQATDRGFGGGLTDESPMAWALPAQMEKVNWTNPVIGTAGEARDVTALVTDEAGDPVENARVTFEVTDGDGPPVGPVSVWTGADGLAKLPQWTLGPA
ncbi:MAG TPA: hypothetical protein VD793_03900, partial [Gemmatimonadales bacterium]|nr:hypothetical protein [Gemmatimonadales bacterium]